MVGLNEKGAVAAVIVIDRNTFRNIPSLFLEFRDFALAVTAGERDHST